MMLKDAHKRTMFAVRGAVSLASRPMRRVVPRSCRRAQSGCPGRHRVPRAARALGWGLGGRTMSWSDTLFSNTYHFVVLGSCRTS